MDNEFFSLDRDQRIVLVRQAAESGQPLLIRWGELPPHFSDKFHRRAAIAAEWLTGATSVADLGCGTMYLERCLRPGQRYIPADVARRDDRTHVIDLNNPEHLAQLPEADACTLLGVLEYLCRPRELISALSKRYDQIVATFNVSLDGDDLQERLGRGWINAFTTTELSSLFAENGYTLMRDCLFGGAPHEYIFEWRKTSADTSLGNR